MKDAFKLKNIPFIDGDNWLDDSDDISSSDDE